ncbi:TonB-dependent receptor [Xylophilus sp.]|uniref:TonB-dependent receptor n=1 Tax=Xylophilus sp. TaxID=2653893 RepID=UPI0013B737E3|nr:TonB-dependent receptor plug domain-containing protein [Xylophilus sp.]KAF1049163.1 MAG: Pesticin receptor [Xylophilus sp.]
MSLLLYGSAVSAQQPESPEKVISDLREENRRLREELKRSHAGATQEPSQPVATAQSAVPVAQQESTPQTLDTVVIRSKPLLAETKDVPQSISVVSGAELDQLQANDVTTIVKRVGNLSWNQGNQQTSSLSIRGLAKQSSQVGAQDPSVGSVVDGVPYALNSLINSYYFADIASVEVARGPQGTKGGKNAVLGTLSINTNRPSFTPTADYSLVLGQRDRITGTAVLGGSVIDDLLAWRGSFVVDHGAGYFHTPYSDVTYSDINRIAGRAQFLLTPTADFDARLSLNFTPKLEEHTNWSVYTPTPTVYSNGTANTLGTDASTRLARRWFKQNTSFTYQDDYLYGGRDGHTVSADPARGLTTETKGASAELNWRRDGYTLTSITAWQNYYFNAINDEYTPFDINPNSGGSYARYHQLSEEIRLSAKSGSVDWQTGLYLLNVRNDYHQSRKTYGSDAGAWYASTAQYNRLDATAEGQSLMRASLDGLSVSNNRTLIKHHSYAVYGQADWRATEQLTVTAGARLTWEKRTATGNTSYISNNGSAGELNAAAVGGFDSDSAGLLTTANTLAQLQIADSVASRFFNVSPTSVAGQAYSSLTAAQKQQVADAKTIRASQLGVLYSNVDAEPFKKIQPGFVLSPSFKVNDDLTTYVSWQYGEKQVFQKSSMVSQT